MEKIETIIIGGGPAGSSAAVYLARFCHEVLILDAPEEVHGRTSMATGIRNFLGHTMKVTGGEMLSRIKNQREEYEAITYKEEKVTKVSKEGDIFIVQTEAGNTYSCTYLIIAVGLSDNMPEIDSLDPYYDTAIFHCLTCDWYEHRNMQTVIVANDDRGITTALALDSMNRPPLLSVVPAKEPKFSEEMVQRAKDKNIAVYTSPIKGLNGLLGNLSSVTLEDGTKVDAEVLFTRLGHVRLDTFLDKGDIKPDRESEEGFITVDWRTYESSVKNMFAIGPCNDGPDQAIVAAGEGAIVGMELHRRILESKGI